MTPTGSQPSRTWRKSAPRRPPVIPCDCCKTVHAFKRKHGMTPFQAYQREHWPMLAAWEENRMGDYHRLAAERAATAKVLRDALAYCIECRNPMLATEYGFQFCPYERADRAAAPSYGQHEKVKRAPQTDETPRAKASVFSLIDSARWRRQQRKRKYSAPMVRQRRKFAAP